MKPIVLAGVVSLTVAATEAMAACPTTGTLTSGQLVSRLSNKYVCAQRGTDRWNELHQGTGLGPSPIEDYKKGPGDAMDPSKVVGSYQINNNGAAPATVTYNYGGPAVTYTYVVTRVGADLNTIVYDFCNVATSEVIRTRITSSPICVPPT